MIGIDHTNYTSIGTGTTKTLLGGAKVILPSRCRSILSIMPQVTVATPTTVEGVNTQFDVESDDVVLQPYQVIGAPIAPVLGATGTQYQGPVEKWPIGCPTNGGEQVSISGTALVGNTVAPTAGCGIVVSDLPAPFSQRHSKIGTYTSTGTTANTDVAMTAFTFTGGSKIVEVWGTHNGITVAAADAMMGMIKFTSSEFGQSLPVKLPLNSMAGLLGATGQMALAGTSRQPVDINISPSQTTIRAYGYWGDLPASAGNFIAGVIYT